MSQIETIMGSKAAMIVLALVAFLVAALLVLIIVRMLFGGRLRMPGGRARQARLGIVDAFDLDRQRQLIIVRRDNTEHLIMIGGPNDILIESEIVRVEARDFRDGRREKDAGIGMPGGDGRIPAPPAVERGETRLPDLPPPPRPADEPMLPMPLPVAPPAPPVGSPVTFEKAAAAVPNPEATSPAVPVNGQVEPTPPRVPTFPLPPRRPIPAPERRAPPPLRLPDSVSRTEEQPQLSATTPAEPSGPPPMAPPAAAPPRTAPPFLKPLPPRPPVRPLQRTTPQPAAAPAPVPAPAASGAVVEAAPAPVDAAASPRPQPAPESPKPAPQPPAESTDALESLEEEMAKLLGRGPG